MEAEAGAVPTAMVEAVPAAMVETVPTAMVEAVPAAVELQDGGASNNGVMPMPSIHLGKHFGNCETAVQNSFHRAN